MNGNERADTEVKKAAKGDSSQASDLSALLATDPLLHSVTATHQCFRASLQDLWRTRWITSLQHTWMATIDDTLLTKNFYKSITGFTRAQTSLITQLCTTHILLNKHLY